MGRLSIPEYVMALAHVAALRSEDPYRKVGAAALDADNRVIGTAYNGLFPGYDAPPEFWASRNERQKFMLHAEINLCSLFKRGEARIVVHAGALRSWGEDDLLRAGLPGFAGSGYSSPVWGGAHSRA